MGEEMTAPRVMFARAGPIGNALAAVPALRALRKAWPEAFITLILEPAASQAMAGCPYVNEIIVYDKRGADSGFFGWLRVVRQLRKRKFTHAILSKRFFRMSFLAFAGGAEVRVGFEGYGCGINRPVKWDPKEHAIKANLALVAELGVNPDGYKLEIWPSEEDKEAAAQFLRTRNLIDNPFLVAIHSGGVSQMEYLWPVKNYIELAKSLEETYSAMPIFIGGPPDSWVLSVVNQLVGEQFPICRDLNIRAMAHLISRCRIFIGSNSAPSHLACAVNTPSLIYYGSRPEHAEDIARWKPLTGKVVAALPSQKGAHPEVTQMMEHVAQLLRMLEPDKRRNP